MLIAAFSVDRRTVVICVVLYRGATFNFTEVKFQEFRPKQYTEVAPADQQTFLPVVSFFYLRYLGSTITD